MTWEKNLQFLKGLVKKNCTLVKSVVTFLSQKVHETVVQQFTVIQFDKFSSELFIMKKINSYHMQNIKKLKSKPIKWEKILTRI